MAANSRPRPVERASGCFGACAIAIPPLRERRGEIPSLARRALLRCAERAKLDGPNGVYRGSNGAVSEGEYDGNVRQPEGMVLSAFLARHRRACVIDVEHLPPQFNRRLQYRRHGDPETNRIVIERILRITGGNVKKAARFLGVSRTTINAVRLKSGTQNLFREPPLSRPIL